MEEYHKNIVNIVREYTSGRVGKNENSVSVTYYPAENNNIDKVVSEFSTAGLTQEQLDSIVDEQFTWIRDGREYTLQVTELTDRNELVFEIRNN